ncbi:MAG: HAD domain-containing protein [Cyclobacteriaceae bacterium]
MLIFLDIDGVMVPATSWKAPQNLEDGIPMFTQRATDALKSLISNDTTIILITSHRTRFTSNQWKGIFERRGLKIDKLSSLEPNLDFKKRKDEILGWFTTHDIVDDFIIIDDDTSLNALPKDLKEHLILTSPLIGLTPDLIANFRKRHHLA